MRQQEFYKIRKMMQIAAMGYMQRYRKIKKYIIL